MIRNKIIFISFIVISFFILFFCMNFAVVKSNEKSLVTNFRHEVELIMYTDMTSDELYDRYGMLKLVYVDGVLVEYPSYYPEAKVFKYNEYSETDVNRDSVSSFVFRVYEFDNELIIFRRSVYVGVMTNNALFNLSLVVYVFVIFIIIYLYFYLFYNEKMYFIKLKTLLNTKDYDEGYDLEQVYNRIEETSYLNKVYKELLSYGKTALVLLDVNGEVIFTNTRAESFILAGIKNKKVFKKDIIEKVLQKVNDDEFVEGEFDIDDRKFIYTGFTKLMLDKKYLVFYLTDVSDSTRHKNNQIAFFNQASHELRTPLTIILGYIELLSICNLDEENYKKMLDSCLTECKKMDKLIESIIDISKRFKKDDLYTKANITKLVNKYIDKHKAYFDVKLNLYLHPNAMLICNHLKVELILNNLIKNAYVHNIRGGYIDIVLTEHNREVELIIRNSTKELNEEEASRVFEPFFKCTYDSDSKIVGNGLGLCLVETVCKSYNYRVLHSYDDKVFEIKILFYNDEID